MRKYIVELIGTAIPVITGCEVAAKVGIDTTPVRKSIFIEGRPAQAGRRSFQG